MAISQNVLFEGAPPIDAEFEHPPGCSIARVHHEALTASSWVSSPFDNWPDCGWFIQCTQGDASLLISFVQVDDGKWMLQVAPTLVPGLIGRFLKKQPSATPDQCFALATEVHDILSSSELFSGFQWCWGGYPDDTSSTGEPVEYNESG